jgi:carbon-monoxide dehydrogenase large subunit
MTETGIGARVLRKEDRRFLTGTGRYVDDISRPRQAHAWFVRSPHAHANILGIDAAPALAAPGVIAVLTGATALAAGLGGLPCGWQINNKDGSPMAEPAHPILAQGKVRHVGDPVAVVIAETRAQARNGAEVVAVDYEPLPAVVDTAKAAEPGQPRVHDEAPDNTCYDWEFGDKGATEEAFAGAHHVTRLDLVNQRLVPNAIEPRAAIGEYDPGEDRYTLYTTSQNPHLIRLLMCAYVLNLPETKVRVVSPDVGGGFGSKIYHYAEEAVVTWAARKVARPVKWTAERSESFVSDAQGRDHVTRVELALDENAKFLGLKVATVANLGAYLSTFGPAIPTYFYAPLLAGEYTTPAVYCEVRGVFTNTVTVDAYRGAGRPEACFLLERVVDVAAREMGLDAAEIRRRNLIPESAQPYQTPVAMVYDGGNYAKNMEDCLKAADAEGFAARKAGSASRGKLRGLGMACYVEACGAAPSAIAGALGARAGLYEMATVRVNPTGTVTVITGTHSHGQGHETTFAQLVSERLGLPLEGIEVVHGDTDRIPFGMGTYASRSLAVGGAALVKSIDKVIDKGRKIAAHILEASAEDVEFADGKFTVAGTDKALAFAEVALAAYVPHNYPHEELEPGLEETSYFDPPNFTFPSGCYLCEVEIDPDTGAVEIVRFTAVDDFGVVINPTIVEGQVHGGLAQGIGQALYEGCRYDTESGQLVTGSFLDYCMPKADAVPSFAVSTNVTRSPTNPLGVRGCGEAGAIGSPPAVINAICDALKDHGVTHIDMPATPEAVWRAIHGGARAAAAE